MAEIDNLHVSTVVCPHCGDSWEPDTHVDDKYQCDECHQWYYAETDYDVTYCTRKIEPPTSEVRDDA